MLGMVGGCMVWSHILDIFRINLAINISMKWLAAWLLHNGRMRIWIRISLFSLRVSNAHKFPTSGNWKSEMHNLWGLRVLPPSSHSLLSSPQLWFIWVCPIFQVPIAFSTEMKCIYTKFSITVEPSSASSYKIQTKSQFGKWRLHRS